MKLHRKAKGEGREQAEWQELEDRDRISGARISDLVLALGHPAPLAWNQ